MKKHFIILAALLAAACNLENSGNEPADPQEYNEPGIYLSASSFSFKSEEEQTTVALSSDCDWSALPSEPWISVDPQSGAASNAPVLVNVSVSANDGDAREGNVSFQANDGSASAVLRISQEGKSPAPVVPELSMVTSLAVAYGDTYFDGINEIDILFSTSANIDEETWDLLDKGTMIFFEFLCAPGSGTVIPDGTYPINNSGNPGTVNAALIITTREYIEEFMALMELFGDSCTYEQAAEYLGLTGVDPESMVSAGGAAAYIYDGNGGFENRPIVSGSVNVSHSGDKYSVTCSAVGLEGEKYDFTYSGSIEVEDGTDEGGGGGNEDEITSVDFGNMSYAFCVNYGDYYDLGANDWYLELSDEDGYGICVDILSNSNSIPTGTFPISDSFTSGTAMPGGLDEDGYGYGAWYCDSEYLYAPCDNGSISISASAGKYSISFEFTSSEYETGYTGKFTGQIDDLTDSQSKASLNTAKPRIRNRRHSVIHSEIRKNLMVQRQHS